MEGVNTEGDRSASGNESDNTQTTNLQSYMSGYPNSRVMTNSYGAYHQTHLLERGCSPLYHPYAYVTVPFSQANCLASNAFYSNINLNRLPFLSNHIQSPHFSLFVPPYVASNPVAQSRNLEQLFELEQQPNICQRKSYAYENRWITPGPLVVKLKPNRREELNLSSPIICSVKLGNSCHL